jgi:cold shock protein
VLARHRTSGQGEPALTAVAPVVRIERIMCDRKIGQGRVCAMRRVYDAIVSRDEYATGVVEAATVQEWRAEEGWGVIDSERTPGGCWVHFAHIEARSFRELTPGQRVRLEWESPGQDGYDFRALRVTPEAVP